MSKYLNEFHKSSEERKIKKIQESKKNPAPASEAAKKHFEMHKNLAKDNQPKIG